MKLLRVGEFNQEIVATLDKENKLRDLSSYIKDLNPSTFNEDNLKKLKKLNLKDLPEIKPNRIGSCFNKPTNYFCVGKNFHLHALEVGSKAPKDPMIFSKAISCLSGPNDNIIIPKASSKVDWECEIGVCLKDDAYQITKEDSEKYIGGYFLANDVSARDFQLEKSGQFIIGKSAPSFGPIGPFLVTPDEIADVKNLNMKIKKMIKNTAKILAGLKLPD